MRNNNKCSLKTSKNWSTKIFCCLSYMLNYKMYLYLLGVKTKRMILHIPFTGENLKSWSSWVRFSEDKLQDNTHVVCFLPYSLASAVQGLQIASPHALMFLHLHVLPTALTTIDKTSSLSSCSSETRVSILFSTFLLWVTVQKISSSKLDSFWIRSFMDLIGHENTAPLYS